MLSLLALFVYWAAKIIRLTVLEPTASPAEKALLKPQSSVSKKEILFF